MWTICEEQSQEPAPGTEDIQGNQQACLDWLEQNQVYYSEENPSPVTGEPKGSKYILLDLTDHYAKIEELKLQDVPVEITVD